MARSLAKINEQIAKLQKEADSIQSGVIARIKREIAQHGLTAEHLFGADGVSSVGNGRKAAVKASARKPGAAKPAKYADEDGNSWHGIGKRPQWIHNVLNAGRSLEEFLVGGKKAAPAAKAARAAAKATPRKGKKVAPRKKAAAASAGKPLAKKTAKATAAPAKRSAKKAVPAKADAAQASA